MLKDCEVVGPAALNIFSLPLELFHRIFAELDFPSCATVSQLCKLFNKLNNTPVLWTVREKSVKERCLPLIKQECLPDDTEVNYVFNMSDMAESSRSRFRMCFSLIVRCSLFASICSFLKLSLCCQH
jgi:hypothetical protein